MGATKEAGKRTVNYQDMVGSLRRHWRIAVGVFFVSVLIAIGFFLTRPAPSADKEFQATAKFQLPTVASNKNQASNAAPVAATPAANVPDVLTQNLLAPALADDTLEQAKKNANLAPSPAVNFKAELNATETVITLTTSSQNKKQANKAIDAYADAFTDARQKAVAADATTEQRGITSRLDSLDKRRREIENRLRPLLKTLPPYVLVNSNGSKSSGDGNNESQVPVLDLPDDLSQQGRLLANERNSLYSDQVRLEAKYGALSLQLISTDPYAEMTSISAADRVENNDPSPLIPMAAIIGLGALVGLAAALFFDRLDSTIHNSPAAESALTAQVLSSIPPRHHFEDQYADPAVGNSMQRASAYRQLAATSVATDRLPKALLVTSPTGDTQDGVALNYAASLADLGLRVALIATTPEQAWFVEPFGHTAGNLVHLPELLTLAHAGTLDASVIARMGESTDAPNLFVVPPGESVDLDLPLDGLAPLLAALDGANFDVTIIAGPSMLNNANATIYAWSIRNVLWAVETHQVKEGDARNAAAHLELTGGTAFGVAVVGQEI